MERDGTRMHYVKEASLERQGDAMENLLQGILGGSWHSFGCYFDIYLLLIVLDQEFPLMAATSSNASGG